MSVVAVAILISFHLKHSATPLEKKVALPFGLIFWFLSMACLISGLSNYVKTVSRYSRRQALVQTGWGTQVVRLESPFAFLSIDRGLFSCFRCLLQCLVAFGCSRAVSWARADIA